MVKTKDNIFDAVEAAKIEDEKTDRMKKLCVLAIPTLVYALLTTIFLYNNFNSILTTLFTALTVVYVRVILKKFDIPVKKGFNIYCADIILFGIADAFTANSFLVFFNNVAIFILIVSMLIYTTYDQLNWSFAKYFESFMTVILNAVECIGDLISDVGTAILETKSKKTRTGLYCGLGILFFIPIAFIIVPLLSSADAVFDHMIEDFFLDFFSFEKLVLIPGFFVLIFVSAYCGMRSIEKRNIDTAVRVKKKWSAIIANTVLVLVNLIYVLFSGIQIVSLFLGKMKLPEAYTYAEYAREGFFQLMVVCLLNLGMVLFTKENFEVNILTKLLLCIVSACTYVMLASSAMRLYLYIKVYNLTTLRFEVGAALIVIAVCLAITIAAIFNNKLSLVHSLALVVVSTMIIISFVRPDAAVAKYNLSHINEKTDYYYLQNLSADAAPYISKADIPSVNKDAYFHDLELENYSVRQFNVSRFIAEQYKKNRCD